MLNQILPVLLRFMADRYDDTCSTVFPLLQTILSGVSDSNSLVRTHCSHTLHQYKRNRKISTEPLDDAKRSFLVSLLEVILEKLKWDPDGDPDDLDEDDKVAFEGLRKVYDVAIPLACNSSDIPLCAGSTSVPGLGVDD